ncbi:pilus protein [Escherichia coli]|nr:pilus protein [Escherichia coli]
MEARQGGDSSAGSVHDSPPRQGDARKRHKQENNKTESNQSSRKKKNSSRSSSRSSSSSSSSSRNNNIISNRQMTGLKRQKPTAEGPRNERGGASARPLSAPPARGLFPAQADGHLSSRLPGVIRHADE